MRFVNAIIVASLITSSACSKSTAGGEASSQAAPTTPPPTPPAGSVSGAPRGRIKYPLAGWKQSQESSNWRTSEAKQTVGAIARAAIAAYERETTSDPAATTATHRMCKSAQQVPFTVPREKKYQPNSSPGADYDAGGPDPGPDGFEASAEGDLDGDGVTSLFTLIGVVENGELRKEKSIFMTDPDE